MIRAIEEEILGLRPGRLIELILAVEHAEAEQELASEDVAPLGGDRRHPTPPKSRPTSTTGQKVAVELYVRGWDEETIDRTFGWAHGATEQVLKNRHHHPAARQVVAAHFEGDPPSRISRDLNVGLTSVLRTLASIGEEPNRVRDLAPAKSADVNQAIKRRYEEGWSYVQIARHLGISETKVKNRLAYLRKKGRIELPPRPRTGRNPNHL